MKPLRPSSFFAVAAFSLLSLVEARGQAASSSSAAPGWGSVWMEPANDQERRIQGTAHEVEAAEKAGNPQAALALCDQQIRKTPSSVRLYLLRASLYAQLKRYELALEDVERAKIITRQNQHDDETAKLCVFSAALYERKRDYAAAVSDLQASLKLDRNNTQALNSLAWLRATALDPGVRNGSEGVELAKRAVALEPPASAYAALDTLAAAYAEANDYRHAVECEKRALDDAIKEVKNTAKAQSFQRQASERLALFEQRHPYHADLP